MQRLLHSPAVRIALLALTLGLLFLGQRGIWDPDEGRYTNVALHMLDSGNWIEPHRSTEIAHWTKPPLTYWAIAGSVGLFGHNAWAARLPAALSYLLCVWLAWRIARRVAPGSEPQAALLYATMLFPIGAAQFISTDYVLAACETLAMWGFIEARFGANAHPQRWLLLMWAGFALAFLAKGPPGLLPLLAVVGFDLSMPGMQRPRALQWQGLLLFLLVAAPWYVAVTLRNPGLLDYFLGKEVVGRVASDTFARHGQWYGWIAVYAPTLLLGTLPWTPALLRWARTLPARLRQWRGGEGRMEDRAGLLLALWLLVPLLVFCASRSRLPLYILPLFVPLAVLAARQRLQEGLPLPRWRWLLAALHTAYPEFRFRPRIGTELWLGDLKEAVILLGFAACGLTRLWFPRTYWELVKQFERLVDGFLAGLPHEALHESVDGEWSFIETLRHLVFATDAWVRRALLGDPEPWDALDLPHDDMPDSPPVPRDRGARRPRLLGQRIGRHLRPDPRNLPQAAQDERDRSDRPRDHQHHLAHHHHPRLYPDDGAVDAVPGRPDAALLRHRADHRHLLRYLLVGVCRRGDRDVAWRQA